MEKESRCRPSLEIIVPLCGQPQLCSPLFQSLSQPSVTEELLALGCSVTIVRDSPEDADLGGHLQGALAALRAVIPCVLLSNPERSGFVAGVNQAFRSAVEKKSDVILLKPEAVVSPGALTELCQVGDLDAMIGFVRPRSNFSSICSLPHSGYSTAMTSAEGESAFRELSGWLPRFQFVPPGGGPCQYIRRGILEELGFFDEGYGQGDDPELRQTVETDLIMRANRCGYRVALANRAFIYSSVESTSPGKPAERLAKRYPEYSLSTQRYLDGERYPAERLLTGLIPDNARRLDLLLDFSSVGAHHNGSFVFCKQVLKRAPRLWPQFNIYVSVSDEARRFHQLDRVEGVQFVPVEVQRTFAVALRLVQPFLLEQITRLSRQAPVNVYAMLDPIMFDCQYLNSPNPDDLETLWSAVFSNADGVIYISDFARDLFHHRFRRRPGLRELVAYPSLDVNEYRPAQDQGSQCARHILVMGNKLEHKRVKVTVDALNKAFPGEKIVSIGPQLEAKENVIHLDSGRLTDEKMEDLISGARLVVYPSTYEGFGLPILEGLARKKPVLARSLAVTRTIRERIACPDNLILFSSTSDLVERLGQGFPTWRIDGEHVAAAGNWDSTTSTIGDFLTEVTRSLDFENVLMPRICHMHLLDRRAQAAGDVSPIFGAPQDRVEQIYASWSWRVTAPLRWFGSKYLQLKRR